MVNFRNEDVLVTRVSRIRAPGHRKGRLVMFRSGGVTSLHVFQVRVGSLFGHVPVSSSIIPAIFEYAFVPRDASL